MKSMLSAFNGYSRCSRSPTRILTACQDGLTSLSTDAIRTQTGWPFHACVAGSSLKSTGSSHQSGPHLGPLRLPTVGVGPAPTGKKDTEKKRRPGPQSQDAHDWRIRGAVSPASPERTNAPRRVE